MAGQAQTQFPGTVHLSMAYILTLEEQIRSLTKSELAEVRELAAKSSTLSGKFENVEDIARLNKNEASRLNDLIIKVLKQSTKKRPKGSNSPRGTVGRTAPKPDLPR